MKPASKTPSHSRQGAAAASPTSADPGRDLAAAAARFAAYAEAFAPPPRPSVAKLAPFAAGIHTLHAKGRSAGAIARALAEEAGVQVSADSVSRFLAEHPASSTAEAEPSAHPLRGKPATPKRSRRSQRNPSDPPVTAGSQPLVPNDAHAGKNTVLAAEVSTEETADFAGGGTREPDASSATGSGKPRADVASESPSAQAAPTANNSGDGSKAAVDPDAASPQETAGDSTSGTERANQPQLW